MGPASVGCGFIKYGTIRLEIIIVDAVKLYIKKTTVPDVLEITLEHPS
jgi:hypothetical protein